MSRKCIPSWAADDLFEVKSFSDKYIVNLLQHSCTCRKWDLIGIPCQHAISAIFLKHEDVEDYVSHWYTVETYRKSYEHIIYPVPSEKFWDDSGLGPVAPPLHKNQPGRPKKLRRRDPEESVKPFKVRKTGVIMRCSNCKGCGHNKTTCKAPHVESAPPPASSGARKGKLPVRNQIDSIYIFSVRK